MPLRRNAMPTPSNATPLPLRCAAMLCPRTANQSRALPLLSAAMRPLCLAMHSHARASPITAFAVPIIAVTTLCVASPARCHPLPSPCFSPLSRRCAFPRKATAAPCPAVPPLSGAPPRLRSPVLIHARRRPPLPRIAFALQCLSPPLRLIAARRIARAVLVNPSPDREALGHASPSPCAPGRFLAGAHPALRFPSAVPRFPPPGQRFLRFTCAGPV